MLKGDGLLAQPGGEGGKLHGGLLLRPLLLLQGLVPLQPLPALGAPGGGALHHPLELPAEDGLPLALAGLGHLLPLGLPLQVLVIIALVEIELAPLHLHQSVGDPLQEVAVVGDHDQGALEGAEVVLQPGNHAAVQVVGGLVQDEDVAAADQGGAQGHPLPLAAGELPHRLVEHWHPQPGEDGLGLVLGHRPCLVREAGKDLLQHGVGRVEVGELGQVVQAHVGVPAHRAAVGLLRPRKDAQQGTLSRTVDADNPQLLAGLQVEGHVVQHGPRPVSLCNVFRRKQHMVPSLLWICPPVYTISPKIGTPPATRPGDIIMEGSPGPGLRSAPLSLYKCKDGAGVFLCAGQKKWPRIAAIFLCSTHHAWGRGTVLPP